MNERAVRDALATVEQELADDARSSQAKDVLTGMKRTLEWLLSGQEGLLFDPRQNLLEQFISPRPRELASALRLDG